MDIDYLFEPYETLVIKADNAFHHMEEEHGECIKCRRGCSDCCHAVFGLFAIEAVFLKQDFDKLDSIEMEQALIRADKADQDLKRLDEKLRVFENDPRMTAYSLARERIRCPLLNDNDECLLYQYRPVTCRVYGIPVAIQGQSHACGKSAFKTGEEYPSFDLDSVYRELHLLSRELIKKAGQRDLNEAALLLSVSRIIKTPVEKLIGESLDGRKKTALKI
jgi:Fe-S-cluster containining protein